MPTKPKPKRGPGQPRKLDRDKAKPVTVSISSPLRTWLASIGGGSVSTGARLVLTEAYKSKPE